MSETVAYNYNIDVFTPSQIAGWICPREDRSSAPLTVQFLVDGVPSGIVRADIARFDVAEAGLGPPHCGFHWHVPDVVGEGVARRDLPVEIFVRRRDGCYEKVGERVLRHEASLTDEVRAAMRPALENAIAQVTRAALVGDGSAEPVRGEPKRFPLHERLFLRGGNGTADARCSVSRYLDFQHVRLKKDATHPLDGSEATKNRYLRWYLDHYLDVRRPMRGPLGAKEIAYLNCPVALLGVEHKISRASLSYGLTSAHGVTLFPLTDQGRYEEFVRWWCVERAVELHVEDCLVPEYYVEALRRIPVRYMGQDWPLSVFIEGHFNANVRFHVFDGTIEQHRLLVHVWLLLEAMAQPGVIRFLPQKNLTALFDGPPRETLFDRTVQSLHPSGEAIGELFDATRYARHLASLGFDLKRRRFLAFDTHGNRFEAARFAPTTDRTQERVPVQIIGPFAKSSGLGQAARLSAATLKAAGYTPNVVDFDLDNPAPIGMNSNSLAFGLPRPADVNLLHLNGETLPMALAYLRDAFNGAYNIGYFFWELSRPSRAQELAIELVDEIWVATDYGVSVYADAGKPVHNVGMAVEPVSDPGRDVARAWLSERLPVGPNTFVFLAAFDSFSFVERKNPHGVVEAFRAAFDDADDDVHLVLKTHNRDFVSDPHQTLRWDRLIEVATHDPRITILNETLRYGELMKLIKGADCYVSLHRSEGWGFGLIEAMGLGVPILATAYSGNMDFTRPEHAFLVDYDLVEPRPNEYIFVDGGQVWAAPRLESAVEAMRAVRTNPAERARRARVARAYVMENFSLAAQAKKYRSRLDEVLAMRRR
ncbi:glycosyltransferase [Acuticoccus sp.]|uniref:glycosyltransferase n=1 Tax=Acuticoccus sp. TaxID=1904378 RepID=UPI003B5175AA